MYIKIFFLANWHCAVSIQAVAMKLFVLALLLILKVCTYTLHHFSPVEAKDSESVVVSRARKRSDLVVPSKYDPPKRDPVTENNMLKLVFDTTFCDCFNRIISLTSTEQSIKGPI